MHSYLTNASQPFIYSDYSLFVAEVASNFNQALTRAWLLQHDPDRDFQIAIIEEAMKNFHRYLFLMPILSQFEQHIYEQVEQNQALTADGMSALLLDLFRRGYGPAVSIDEPRAGITWAQFPQLYRNFYVYQYASGIAAANALAAQVLTGDADAVQCYLAFLKTGSSRYPLDALKLAGVDMTSPEPIDRAFGVLETFIVKLEELTA
jgi:oligoendopeptidase F